MASPWITSDFVKLSLPQVTPAPSAAPRHYLLHNRSGWSEQSDIHCDDRVSSRELRDIFQFQILELNKDDPLNAEKIGI